MALLVAACGEELPSPRGSAAVLLPLDAGLLVPGVPFQATLVKGDRAARVALAHGILPSGIELGEDGVLRGTPSQPGEHRRFEVELRSGDGVLLARRAHALSVGVVRGDLVSRPTLRRDGDALSLQHDFGRTIAEAFVWDHALGLAWPLRPGARIEGQLLAPPGGSLSLLARGPSARGQFLYSEAGPDLRIVAVAQLAWARDSDLDLVAVPAARDTALASADGGRELSAGNRWVLRRAVASARGPGAEALVVAEDLPAGAYHLYALKLAGEPVDLELWLSIRTRNGESLAEERFAALLSDLSLGSVDADREAGRQSYQRLGTLHVDETGLSFLRETPFQPGRSSLGEAASGEGG